MQFRELDWLHDHELLRRLGRKPLAAIFDLLAPFLGQQGLALPDASLPDERYFADLASLLGSQPIKLAAYLPPFLAAAPPAEAGAAQAPCASPAQLPRQPRYALRREGDLWHLTLDGRPAVLNHEQGIWYVAEMLRRPGEPVKKLNLVSKYSKAGCRRRGGIEVYDPASGSCITPSSSEPVHEAALAADDAEARRAYQQRARALVETIQDPTETEQAIQGGQRRTGGNRRAPGQG